MTSHTKKLTLLLCLTFIGLNSCNESRLDIVPGFPTEESYFSEEIEFTRAVYGVYAKMPLSRPYGIYPATTSRLPDRMSLRFSATCSRGVEG
jgi:hypothetical protein